MTRILPERLASIAGAAAPTRRGQWVDQRGEHLAPLLFAHLNGGSAGRRVGEIGDENIEVTCGANNALSCTGLRECFRAGDDGCRLFGELLRRGSAP